MGYSGDYSICARCFSEFASTFTFVFFVGCLMANKLLPKTKASDLSFGWVAFGVGLIVYVPTQFFDHISCMFNPATTLGAAIAGKIDWTDFPFLVLAQLIGAFVGNVLLWIFYLPMFETDPEPAPTEDNDRLLQTRDDISPAALNFVSYSTRPEAAVPAAGVGIREFGRMLSAARSESTPEAEQWRVFSVSAPGNRSTGRSLRKSVSVSYADSRLQVIDGNTTLRRRRQSMTPSGEQENGHPLNQTAVDVESIINTRRRSRTASIELSSVPEDHSAKGEMLNVPNDSVREMDAADSTNKMNGTSPSHNICKDEEKKTTIGADQEKLDPKLVASQIADQQMKLSIFCTRPARYLPISNLVTEIIATFFLVIGLFLIAYRVEFLYDGYDDLYMHGILPFLVGIFCAVLVLCFGGMGVSTNPARDLASRFAHWVLPIDGKGASEWYYAWITVVGPFIGGALAGVAFLALKELNKAIETECLRDSRTDQIHFTFNLEIHATG